MPVVRVVTCPCGCEQQVGWSRRGAAVGAETMAANIGIIEAVITEGLDRESLDEFTLAGLERFAADGRQIREWFLQHVHGTADPVETPDVLSLRAMMLEYEPAARERAHLADARY
jgi:hypothetical protein